MDESELVRDPYFKRNLVRLLVVTIHLISIPQSWVGTYDFRFDQLCHAIIGFAAKVPFARSLKTYDST